MLFVGIQKNMRYIKYNFLLVFGLMLTFGLTTAFANGKDEKSKRPKNTGTLTVKTTPNAFPVKVDGIVLGMSGVSTPAEFYLAPGMHLLEIEGPNGQAFKKEIEIRKDAKNCICLKIVENKTERPCPYDVRLDGPDKVVEGDLITFAAFNAVTASSTPLNYAWKVTPENARITSGLGTPAITVDTTGLGGQTVRAELDVWDGVYDASCRQRISVPTIVEKFTTPPPPFEEFDNLVFRSFDDDKARLDNFAIALQNRPDVQGYVIVYQGPGKRAANAEKMAKRSLDYLVKTRGVDPRRIQITSGGNREETMADLFIVPPGASTPVPTPR